MMSVEEARAEVLARVEVLDPLDLMLDEAFGRISATDILARDRLPRFDNSAMDGYAVRSGDLAGATVAEPAELRIVGEVRAAAGAPAAFEAQQTVRIATGAPVPPGADAVVPIEDTAEVDETAIHVMGPVPKGRYIRRAAEDVEVGQVVVPAGIDLGAGELALLAALGQETVAVRDRAKVAVLVTGDELASPVEQAGPGQVYDSNSTAMSALVREAGAEVVLLERVADTASATTAALERAAECADVILSCGGVSVGPYDLVKEAVTKLGSVDHWRVAMQPGKPLVIGQVREVPFLGLPGNPVSVHVTFEQFARPALKKMSGARALLRPRIQAFLGRRVDGISGRRQFVRVRLSSAGDRWEATPTGAQGSHIQSSLVACDGLAILPEESTGADPGTEIEVEVWRLPAR